MLSYPDMPDPHMLTGPCRSASWVGRGIAGGIAGDACGHLLWVFVAW